MVKHIILWQLKDELSSTKKEEVLQGIKEGLEGLQGQIPGLKEIKVQIDKLESSNADVMLYSVFEDEDSLKGYSTNPKHVEVANGKVRPFTKTRTCIDYNC
ncbi:MAG: Dabb family protein [Thomasclavelia sp.]|nr:Dabb family protein [Thomasclavelia sp.]